MQKLLDTSLLQLNYIVFDKLCQSISYRKQAKKQKYGHRCAIFCYKLHHNLTKSKKQMVVPSAWVVRLHLALFVVLAVMCSCTVVTVCHSDARKLAIVVFAVVATRTHVTTDCLLVLHGYTSFLFRLCTLMLKNIPISHNLHLFCAIILTLNEKCCIIVPN